MPKIKKFRPNLKENSLINWSAEGATRPAKGFYILLSEKDEGTIHFRGLEENRGDLFELAQRGAEAKGLPTEMAQRLKVMLTAAEENEAIIENISFE